MQYDLFISCPKGCEYLLEAECTALGFTVDKVSPQGVYVRATLAMLYYACLWLRIANRVHLLLFGGPALNDTMIKQLCTDFAWKKVFSPQHSFAVSFHGTNDNIRNTMYGAQLVKDGIVDHFKKLAKARPNVNKENPDVHIHAYLKKDTLTVSFDLSGNSLHQRHYRVAGGQAPIKENVAAALLLRMQWPERAKKGEAFYDVACGSGTLVIEAAMIAANMAPGLLREQYGFMHWNGHDATVWAKVKQEALDAAQATQSVIAGSDSDPEMVQLATINAEKAGVAHLVSFKAQSLEASCANAPIGLMLCNPPYGERLKVPELKSLYQAIGQTLHTHFQGWQAAVLTSDLALAKSIGLRSHKQYTFYNGPLACKLYCFTLDEKNRWKGITPEDTPPPPPPATVH